LINRRFSVIAALQPSLSSKQLSTKTSALSAGFGVSVLLVEEILLVFRCVCMGRRFATGAYGSELTSIRPDQFWRLDGLNISISNPLAHSAFGL
jgi:hypothetical protein